MNHKKYRVYLYSSRGSYSLAASNTVNNLVALVKYWLENTSAGMYLPAEDNGTIALHVLDEATGAYKAGKALPFKDKEDIITQLRALGAR